MAARDQALFLETYLGLQQALKRKAYDSDSDSSIEQSTNRGNKLKRRARFVRAGQLGAADGASLFTEMVDLAGFRREIISRNPRLVDDDGYEIESDDDEADIQDVITAANEENPYAGIRLEHILAPLTSVTVLPSHPTLSRPFTSKALAELASQGGDWMHKENAALWEVRPLLTKFCGDHIWVDCDLLVTPDDADLFDDAFVARLAASRLQSVPGPAAIDGLPRLEASSADTAAAATNGSTPPEKDSASKNGELKDADMPDAAPTTAADASEVDAKDTANKPSPDNKANGAADKADANAGSAVATTAATQDLVPAAGSSDADAGAAATAAAAADDNNNDDQDGNGDDFIHPLFLAPRSAHPERNVGLPEHEALHVRRLLQQWVQKQEEVARGTRKLHEGLLRADRLRKTVLLWSKAEAHCGANRDLSDGEDWYDKEAWGLAEDLKKGHDEEEEDLQQPHKKTRNRK